ncbi:MAG: InlB B-repeat-containing protein [Lachnospiraceae bacterium]|nr:InlB B-repeat-containing protein [Lachnospiraceae bacterium]
MPDHASVFTGDYYTIPKMTVTRTGYWFQGWSEDKNATVATYKSGSEVFVTSKMVLYAVWKKKTWNKTVDGLGLEGLKNPRVTDEQYDNWTGDHLWYGHYDGTPVRYSILSVLAQGDYMLLDCDSILYKASFNSLKDGDDQPANAWMGSDIEQGLNGSSFLEKSNCFSSVEKEAIPSVKSDSYANENYDAEKVYPSYRFPEYTGLSGSKVFFLEQSELVNAEYGFKASYGTNIPSPFNSFNTYPSWSIFSRHKGLIGETQYTEVDPGRWMLDKKEPWWMRTAGETSDIVGIVTDNGSIYMKSAYEEAGVSPAFFIDPDAVLFNSVVAGPSDLGYTERKLTLLDKNTTVALQSGKMISASGKTITVPYVVGGANASKVTQVSVVILDKPFTVGNSNGASILYYSKINTGSSFGRTGSGMFTLPSNLALSGWGDAYYVYLLAEDVNGMCETDYASTPKLLPAPGTSGTVKLTFDLNGGSVGAPAEISKPVGTTVKIPKSSPYRGGYWFMGWSTSKTATTATYKSESEILLAKNVTLYCVWKKAAAMTYRVSFDRNGGSGTAPSPMTVTTGTTVTVPKCSSINREGYYFMGWSTTRGGAVAYKSGDTIKVTASIVLYASWKPKTNIVTFNVNGGSGSLPATIKVLTGKTATVSKSTMSRNGYWFLGWSESKTATTATYKTGSEISVNKDTVLYAVWKKK